MCSDTPLPLPCTLGYRPPIHLVCKSWSALCFQAPGLWRPLLLDSRPAACGGKLAAWLGAKRALLGRLGSLVTDADVELVDPTESFEYDGSFYSSEDEDEGQQPGSLQSDDVWDGVNALLQALPPSLTELRLALQCGEARAAALALPSLPALAKLQLEAPSAPGDKAVQPVAAAWLPRLPQLRSFGWSSEAVDLSEQLISAIGSLSGLTALELQVGVQAAARVPAWRVEALQSDDTPCCCSLQPAPACPAVLCCAALQGGVQQAATGALTERCLARLPSALPPDCTGIK